MIFVFHMLSIVIHRMTAVCRGTNCEAFLNVFKLIKFHAASRQKFRANKTWGIFFFIYFSTGKSKFNNPREFFFHFIFATTLVCVDASLSSNAHLSFKNLSTILYSLTIDSIAI